MKEKPTSLLRTALIGVLAAATGLPVVTQTDTIRSARATPGTARLTASAAQEKQSPAQAPTPAGSSIGIVRGLDGMGGTFLPMSQGRSPKDWGMSAECARMSRAHKMRRLGIGAQCI